MNNAYYVEINQEEDGQRLDNYLLRVLKGVPKSHVYRIIRGGEVRVNKKRAKVSQRLHTADSVRIPPIRTAASKLISVDSQLSTHLQQCILYEDDKLLVINKPAGLAVHGGSGVSLGVIEALRSMRSDITYLELVHRLDKETSGCLLLAKKRSMLRSIQALFEARTITKTYWALLENPWKGKTSVLVDAPLQKNILQSGERHVVVRLDGKASQTTFKLLENYKQACWVEAIPKTGRTHQIRVHSAYLGHAIIGDEKYGQDYMAIDSGDIKKRLYLHARSIQFNLQDKDYHFHADLDNKFAETLSVLRE